MVHISYRSHDRKQALELKGELEKKRTKRSRLQISSLCSSAGTNIASLHLPRGYEHLAPAVLKFREEYPYDSSVFVMMKSPEELPPDHAKLVDRVFEVTAAALSAYGLSARRADKKQYEPDLWNNLCVHMLGCRFGLAVLEDRSAGETNPT